MPSRLKRLSFALIATAVPLLVLACGWEMLLRVIEPPAPVRDGVP